MTVYIVYREDGYGSYTVRKIFFVKEKAYEFIYNEGPFEQGLLSVEEDIVE